MTKKIHILSMIFLLRIPSLWSQHANSQFIDETKVLEIEQIQQEPALTMNPLERSRLIFNENYQPKEKLLELLEVVGMPSLENSENTILQINTWAQKNLLRQGERWEDQTLQFEALKTKIHPLLKELGFIGAVAPHLIKYQGAIIHGALLPRVRIRLNYLIEQWNQGVRFSTLYFLSGARPLEPEHENKETLAQDDGSSLKIKKDWKLPKELPTTETEMIQLVWAQSDIPEDMRNLVEVHFINAPMKKNPKNTNLIRPTTDDTIKTWLETFPIHGNYLAITNAPYTNRQDTVIRTIAPVEYEFETIGPAASEQEKMAIVLDELARLIFQTKQLAEKQKTS